MAKKIQLQDANGNVLHPLTLGECVTMDNGENLDTLMSKSQMFTPTITQDKSMFKVGTGVDVDYSANVKDGAYESLVFKGKSLVNLAQFEKLFEATPSVLDTQSVIWYGNTSKHYASLSMFKPNTKYIVKIGSETPSRFRGIYISGLNMPNPNGYYTEHNGVFTTPSTIPTEANMYIKGVTGETITKAEYSKCQILILEYQEGMENWDTPYFTGLCDSKMPILRNVGKNLIPLPLIANTGLTWVDGVEHKPSSDYSFTSTGFIKIQTGVYYTSSNTSNMGKRVHCYDEGKRHLGVLKTDGSIVNSAIDVCTSHTFKIDDKNVCYIRLTFYGVLEAAQLEESSTATSYEDHKTNILRTSEEIVLREVSGVCDTYNPLTGEYTKRIGEVVLDGSEGWGLSGFTNDNYFVAYCQATTNSAKANSKIKCDKIQYDSRVSVIDTVCEGINIIGDKSLRISMSKSRVSNLSDFTSWLQLNPVTIQYELAEPVTTIVKPSTMTPFAYQNGHVILESGFEGQSLLPEIEYSVVTGRTGQVTQNTKVLRKQEQQIIGLEELLLTQIVQMEYERTLLQFDYELQMMMLG